MESISSRPSLPVGQGGFRVVFVERILREADVLGISTDWANLPLGHPSGRRTA
jgi:hypothetical protein